MLRNKKLLLGLDQSQYEHPKSTPGIDLVGKFITEHMVERVYNVQYTGSHLRVTKNSYPKIYEYLEYACQILDVKKVPELYIEWGYSVNAVTVGAELGHVKSNHMLYHMMAQVINIIISMIPFGGIAAAPVQLALYYWDRMSEFTADRAGLLCCQNKDAAIRAFMKMAGVPIKQFNDMNYSTFIQQARDFKQLDFDGMNKIIKTISIADDTHPWTVMRAAELINWIEGGVYNKYIPDDKSVLQEPRKSKVLKKF